MSPTCPECAKKGVSTYCVASQTWDSAAKSPTGLNVAAFRHEWVCPLATCNHRWLATPAQQPVAYDPAIVQLQQQIQQLQQQVDRLSQPTTPPGMAMAAPPETPEGWLEKEIASV